MALSNDQIIKILKEVTAGELVKMDDFDFPDNGMGNFIARQVFRNDEFDINCGWCDIWVEEAIKALGGGKSVWFDTLDDGGEAFEHCMLLYSGRLYDSQNLAGTDMRRCVANKSQWKEDCALESGEIIG